MQSEAIVNEGRHHSAESRTSPVLREPTYFALADALRAGYQIDGLTSYGYRLRLRLEHGFSHARLDLR